MKFLRVKNWKKFQHYKDRNPPWIKLHYEIMTSADWVALADASKLLAVVCMMVASRNNGMVPDDPHYLKRVAYLDKLPNLKPLIECGFLENLLADASTLQADARPETYRTDKKKKIKKKKISQQYTTPESVILTEELITWGKLNTPTVDLTHLLKTFLTRCQDGDYTYSNYRTGFKGWALREQKQNQDKGITAPLPTSAAPPPVHKEHVWKPNLSA